MVQTRQPWYQNSWLQYGLMVLAISTLWIFLANHQVNFHDLWQSIHLNQVLCVMMLTFMNLLIRSYRWHYLLKNIDIKQTWLPSLRNYFLGFAFTFTPGKLGEQIRIVKLKALHPISWKSLIRVSIIDRWIDVYASLLLLYSALTYPNPYQIWIIIFLIALTIILLPVNLKKITSLTIQIQFYKQNIQPLLLAITSIKNRLFFYLCAISVVGWLFEIYGLYWLLHMHDHPLTYSQCISIFTLASLTGVISLIPGGIGGFEASAIFFMSQVGVPVPIGVLIIISFRMGTIGFSTVSGFLALIYETLKKTGKT